MRKLFVMMAVALTAAGCGSGSGDSGSESDARLATYRSAIPDAGRLEAAVPRAAAGRKAAKVGDLGDTALYPTVARPVATAINGAVQDMIAVLEAVVAVDPSLYDSETKEYFWGPWPNDDGFGTVAAYIRELPEGSDFQYAYALLRGAGNDVSTFVPVIWGGATPDPNDPDNGEGVTLWDFEANYQFASQYEDGPFDRGRFVAAYGRKPADDDPDARFSYVVSLFRQFVPKGDPTSEAADLDYFYGQYEAADGTVVDFFNFEVGHDIDENGSLKESLDVRLAFLNQGWGRAEVEASGGDLTPAQRIAGVECWDDGLLQGYLHLDLSDGGVPLFLLEHGQESNCGPDISGTPLFAQPLDALQIPSLSDIPTEVMDKLEDVALNGVPQDG